MHFADAKICNELKNNVEKETEIKVKLISDLEKLIIMKILFINEREFDLLKV